MFFFFGKGCCLQNWLKKHQQEESWYTGQGSTVCQGADRSSGAKAQTQLSPHWPREPSHAIASVSPRVAGAENHPDQHLPCGQPPNPGFSGLLQRERERVLYTPLLYQQMSCPSPSLLVSFSFHVYRYFLKHTYRGGREKKPAE